MKEAARSSSELHSELVIQIGGEVISKDSVRRGGASTVILAQMGVKGNQRGEKKTRGLVRPEKKGDSPTDERTWHPDLTKKKNQSVLIVGAPQKDKRGGNGGRMSSLQEH